jgi:hypothetical protein
LLYALPRALRHLDIRDEATQSNPQVVRAASIDELLEIMNEPLSSGDLPWLLEDYKGFNLVSYNDHVFGVSQTLGDLDINAIDANALAKHQEVDKILIADSVEEAKHRVDLALSRRSALTKGIYWGRKKLKAVFFQ